MRPDLLEARQQARALAGTITEIYDYLRLLFARVGHPHCPQCGREITSQTVEQIVDTVKGLPTGSRILVLAPLVRDRKGEYTAIFDDLRKQGYVRVRVDKIIKELSEQINLEKTKKHTIEVVIDRLVIGQSDSQSRLADSVETALKLGGGIVLISVIDGENTFSPSSSPASIVSSASAKSPRGLSALTPLTAPVPPAPGWGSNWNSTPN